jgi:predicted PurR-regulated permease PerM
MENKISDNNIINYRITNGSIVRVMLWLGLAYSIFFFRELLLTLLVGLVIASTIDPIAKFFQKYRIPRAVTVSSVFLILFGSVAAFAFFALPALADDLARLISRLPTLLEQFRVFGKNLGFKDLSVSIGELSKTISKGQILTVVKNAVVGASSVAATTGVVISNIINFALTLIFSFYLAVQDDGIKNFLKLITPKFYEKYILDLWVRSEAKIGSWAKGQMIVALIVSVLVFIPLLILKIPYASLFALLAFLGQLVPVVGLIAASVPAIITAYFTGDISLALVTLAVFLTVSQLENYVITPKIMNSVIGVPAIIILISVIVGAKVAGFWGIVIAVPMAAIMMELVNDILNDKIPSEDRGEIIRYE